MDARILLQTLLFSQCLLLALICIQRECGIWAADCGVTDIVADEELWVDYGKWYWLKLKPKRLSPRLAYDLLQRITPAPPKVAWKRWTPTALPEATKQGENHRSEMVNGKGKAGSDDEAAVTSTPGEAEQVQKECESEALPVSESENLNGE